MSNIKSKSTLLLLAWALWDAQGASAAVTNTAAIPLVRIATQAGSAAEAVEAAATALAADKTTAAVQESLPLLTSEISSTLEETTNILSTTPSLENLRGLSRQWQENHNELAEWRHNLARATTQLDSEVTVLANLDQQWTATRAGLGSSSPVEVSNHVALVLAKIQDMRNQVSARDDLLLTLQSEATEQDDRVTEALDSIEHTREELLSHLLVRDSLPAWSPVFWTHSANQLAEEGRNSLDRQVKALCSYVQRKTSRFTLHALLFVIIALLLRWAGIAIRTRTQKEPGLKPAALIFEIPICTALLLALFASHWIYPQAPRLLWAILGAAALIPAIIVLRKCLDRHLFPVLNLLMVFYFVDQVRAVAVAQAVVSRALFLLEMLAGAIFFALFLRSTHFKGPSDPEHARSRKVIPFVFRLVLSVFAVAFLANVGGFVALSKLLGNTLLRSAYLGLILYALVRIADGLLASALSIPPLVRLGMVGRHRDLLHRRTRNLLGWAAFAIWFLSVLESLSLRVAFFAGLSHVWNATLQVRNVKFSLGDIFLFGVAIWASFIVARLICFVLDEEVYPRISLAPGLQYSISKILHYLVLVLGFFVALAWVGFPLTHLTILAGAFSVGLGFGLQNIVNNFVSGIILLFERPVKVGDVIAVDTGEGVVRHIGIRASIVRGFNGAEIIVPNSSFISASVTNWTFSNRERMVNIPVGLVPGPDAALVIKLLQDAALAHPHVLKDPPPRALFLNFTNSALNFELRAWTSQTEDWIQVRSDISVAVCAALTARQFVIK